MLRVLLLLLLAPFIAGAQKLPSISERTKDLKTYEGFFNFYWDENNGKLLLEVDKIDQEFLYVISLPAGLGSNDIGLDRGLLGDDRIVKFNRVGRKLLLVQPNYKYRAVTANAALNKATTHLIRTGRLYTYRKPKTFRLIQR